MQNCGNDRLKLLAATAKVWTWDQNEVWTVWTEALHGLHQTQFPQCQYGSRYL
jgi:hypothetical protein